MAVRQFTSEGTLLVLLLFVASGAGGAPQRQVWLRLAGSMADGGENEDPPDVEVPGAGADEITSPGGGSSVDDRPTSAGTTAAGALRHRTLFQPLPPGLDPTATRPSARAPSGSTPLEVVLSGAGTHFGIGQKPDVTTWGDGSVPPPARKPAGGSSSCAPPGSRSATGAPPLEHSTGTHGFCPLALGPGGRSPIGALEGGAMPGAAQEPPGGSYSRAPPGSRGIRDGPGLEWRDAVAEFVRYEVTRSLVTMLRGSTPRPAERRGRSRRSSLLCHGTTRSRRRPLTSSARGTSQLLRPYFVRFVLPPRRQR